MTRASYKTLRTGLFIAVVFIIIAVVCGISYLRWAPSRTAGITAPGPGPSSVIPVPVPERVTPQARLPVPPRPRVALGSAIGKIEIPRLHVSTTVLEGTDERELRKGAGHVPSTALPGPSGNVAIAAHRDKFFRALRFIKPNDEIVVATKDGRYRYVVKNTEVVNPSDVGVLQQTSNPELTLITCYPFFYVGHAPHRFIVHAEGDAVLTAAR